MSSTMRANRAQAKTSDGPAHWSFWSWSFCIGQFEVSIRADFVFRNGELDFRMVHQAGALEMYANCIFL